jgi:HAD superfamily hydrolase (TIGR01490 family)
VIGRAAVFDLDRTLLPGSSLVALARVMARNGLLSGQQLLSGLAMDHVFRRRGATDEDVDRLRTMALRQVAGADVAELRRLTDEVGRRLSGQVLPGARMLVRRHQEAGDFIVILSASPQELVEAIATRLGAQRAVGTRAAIEGARYTGDLDGAFCYGVGKVQRLEQDLGPGSLDAATAYADSLSDLPVLDACHEPVAVNPDRQLHRVAKTRGWPVIRFG